MNKSNKSYKRHRFPSEIIQYARRLKRKHQGYGDTFYIDEVFVKIHGQRKYLWRTVDHDGEVVDVFLQARRNGATAKRFFKRSVKESW